MHAYTITRSLCAHALNGYRREPRSAVTLEIDEDHIKNPTFPATRESIWIIVDAESLRPMQTFFPFTSETKCRRTLVRTIFPPSAANKGSESSVRPLGAQDRCQERDITEDEISKVFGKIQVT